MLKIKDIVTDRQGRIFQVTGFTSATIRQPALVLLRLYRSQKRFAIAAMQLKKHPFFS
jgi:hypothetical protein